MPDLQSTRTYFDRRTQFTTEESQNIYDVIGTEALARFEPRVLER
jgi:hypothetical protein